MAVTYEELRQKTLAELREMAKGIDHEAVKGYSQLHKEGLLPALCQALGIDAREHHVVVGIDKAGLKARMRALRAERDKAIEVHDAERLKHVRRQLHHLNHQIRAHMA
ncbi:MAG: hypothetical protein HYX76_15835 [Acidobacteria bacterium]|nr:hypothetical protein [Acidobacteriota bacterium]